VYRRIDSTDLATFRAAFEARAATPVGEASNAAPNDG